MSSKDDVLFHYIIIRTDLTKGQNDAQLGHAAGYSASMWTLKNGQVLPEHTHCIVLGVKDEDHLLEIADTLGFAKVPFKLIEEPDAPFNGEFTAIGVLPDLRKNLSSYLSRLPVTKEIPCAKCGGTPAALPAVRHDGATPTTGNEENGS